MKGSTRRAALISLGCAKNLVDSEHMIGLLKDAGFEVEVVNADGDPVSALPSRPVDIGIVNTCGFIDAAKEESVGAILELARVKEEGRLGAIVVAGCLAQRYADELLREIPQIDAVVGTGEFPRLVEILTGVRRGERQRAVSPPVYRYDSVLPRERLTPHYSAYVKIAEGCDHTCAFCVIPMLRGRYRSRPMESVVAEVAEAAAAGAKEINLIAQDCTLYGCDLTGRSLLSELLERLDRIEGVHWIRVLYNYPTSFNPEVARAMAGLPKVCKYVDIPLQHGSDRILAAMGRGGDRRFLLNRLREIREIMPEAVFRGSFIVGFPGEGEEDFRELLSFLDEIEFDYAGFFTYSREEGTPGDKLKGHVPMRVKERRAQRARERQLAIGYRRNRRHLGRVLDVLVEDTDPDDVGFFRGRWQGQAPEVDGQVIFSSRFGPRPGDMVPVRILWAEEVDLRGEAVEQ